MVDLASKVQFEVCGKKNDKRERHIRFLCRDQGNDGKEDFPDEDILDIELGAWKMYFDGAVN